MIRQVVIIILKSLKDVFKGKFLLNSNNPPLLFYLFPHNLRKAKVSIKILMPIMIL